MKMTLEEFAEKSKNFLDQLPPEFRPMVSYCAYERGHSGGLDEVLCLIQGMVSDLKEPIKNYTDRLVRSQQQLMDACEYGMGFPADSNVLLWNAGQILKEYGSVRGYEHIAARGEELMEKGRREYKAVMAAKNLDNK